LLNDKKNTSISFGSFHFWNYVQLKCSFCPTVRRRRGQKFMFLTTIEQILLYINSAISEYS
jgi:hypothetical protein